MKIVVFGATGTIGRLIADHLEQGGHDVVRASRRDGIDPSTGAGLREALAGAGLAVDALNVGTFKQREAVDFFTTTARNIIDAARGVGVPRLLCVSMYGATDPRVNARFGYYKAKAVQEQVYNDAPMDTMIVHSAQWYELVEQMAATTSAGPVTVLPTMKVAALPADGAARFVARVVEEGWQGHRMRSVRGPEESTLLPMARRIREVDGQVGGRTPRLLREAPYLGSAVAGGGLVPHDAEVDPTTFEQWLAARGEDR